MVFLLVLAGCPELARVTGPDGQPLGDDECLLTIEVEDSCDGCEGFESFEVTLGDAAGESHDFTLAEGEEWVGVVARGLFSIDYTALLFGSPYTYGPEEFHCERTHELSLGCEGFDFCME